MLSSHRVIGRQVLPATGMETALSFLWLAPIQGIECKQDRADLAEDGQSIAFSIPTHDDMIQYVVQC